MLVGRIIKLLAGFYFVQIEGSVLRCRARGKLRQGEEQPWVGDYVEVLQLNDEEGVVEKVLPRTNLLERPTVANITQVVVMASLISPLPNLSLVDRILVSAEQLNLRAVICFNKTDLSERPDIPAIYEPAGYRVIAVSVKFGEDLEPLFVELANQTSVLAGQSGVGKSSLIDRLMPELAVRLGEVSSKSQHGKHTTRHVELIYVPEYKAFIADTPGFSRLDLPSSVSSQDISDLFPEMRVARKDCRFTYDCKHHNEPGCAVKTLVQEGKIAIERYSSYLTLFDEVKQAERSQYK